MLLYEIRLLNEGGQRVCHLEIFESRLGFYFSFRHFIFLKNYLFMLPRSVDKSGKGSSHPKQLEQIQSSVLAHGPSFVSSGG